MLTRISAGLSGSAVISGALGGNATRNTWDAIRDYLAINCSMKVTP
jgi:hypothetical protein